MPRRGRRPRSCRTPTRCGARRARARSPPAKPVTLTWDNGEGLEFRRTIAVDDKYLFTAGTRSTNKGTAPVTLVPLRADLAPRHAEDRRLLHPARRLDRRARRPGPEGRELQERRGEEGRSRFKATNGWLGFTDKYWAATLLPDTKANLAGALLGRHGRHAEDLPDRLPARRADDRAGRDRRRRLPPVRRRQGSADHRRLRQGARAQPLRAADRLGLVLFHHQADVQSDRLLLPSGPAISASRS